MPISLDSLVTNALEHRAPSREDALTVLTDELDVLDLVTAASRLRRHFFGHRVKLNTAINLKRGICPESCGCCSPRLGSESEPIEDSWFSPGEVAETADHAARAGAKRICLVVGGRGPESRDIHRIADTIEAIKQKQPGLEICTCLGSLSDGQTHQLRDAGAYAYSHDLGADMDRYTDMCSTHTFTERVDTARRATDSGMPSCSGAIFGMSESDEDVVSLAFELKALAPESVPINFLIPLQGTPLGYDRHLTPQRCLRILALYRFFFPDVEVRLAGGREAHLRGMQPLALHVANSIFLNGHSAGEGRSGTDDRKMIIDAGFTIEGIDEQTLLPDFHADSMAIRRRSMRAKSRRPRDHRRRYRPSKSWTTGARR